MKFICLQICVSRYRVRFIVKLLFYFVVLNMFFAKSTYIWCTKQQIRRLDPLLFKGNNAVEYSFDIHCTLYEVLELLRRAVLLSVFGIECSFVTLLFLFMCKNILFLFLSFFTLSLFALFPFLSHFADDKNLLQWNSKESDSNAHFDRNIVRHCNFVLHDLYTITRIMFHVRLHDAV